MSLQSTQYFLGNTEIIQSFVGDIPIGLNPIIPPPFTGLPLNGLILFLDGEQNVDTASGYWYNSYGNNITASFFGTPTWDSNNGVVGFTNLQGMVVPPTSIDLRVTDYTIVYSGRYTGAVTDKHGRLLNSLTTNGDPVLLTGNWTMGLYSGSYFGGNPNVGVAWARPPATTNNSWIFLPSGSYDTNWRVFAGSVDFTDVVPGAVENFSSSFYLNGSMLTSSFTSSAFAGGPYGLGINTGSYQDGTIGNNVYENSNCEIADILVYNRVLNSEEIVSASLFLQNRVGI